MTDPEIDQTRADIGIVCALRTELSPFMAGCNHVRKYTGNSFTFRGGFLHEIRIAAVETGIGFARARRATHAMIDAHRPTWILSCGFSGALRAGLSVGDVVMATSIVDTHGHELTVDMTAPSWPGVHSGRLLVTDQVVCTVMEKTHLGTQHGALAVDLESFAVAQVCREAETRFIAVRVISDDSSADLPAELPAVLQQSGSGRLGAALGAVWNRPGSVRDLWQLRENAQQASERLASFLGRLLPQLPCGNR